MTDQEWARGAVRHELRVCIRMLAARLARESHELTEWLRRTAARDGLARHNAEMGLDDAEREALRQRLKLPPDGPRP